MKNLTIVILLFFTFQVVTSQNYKFGKISKDELKETTNPLYQEAHATVLYKSQNISYDYRFEEGFVQINEVQERIKIYDKDGFDWATVHVKLYNGSNSLKEKIVGIKANTYNLVNGKIKTDKLSKQGIFNEEENKYWRSKKFTMPNIKEGCIIEYKYKIETPFISIDDIDLQYTIPIKKLDLSVSIPEYFYFTKSLNPRAAYIPKLTETKVNKTEQVKSRENTGLVRTSINTSDVKYHENVTSANLNNIPPLKEERFVDNLDNYRAKLLWEYAMYRSPSGKVKNYSTNWEQVAETINKNGNFGPQIEKTTYYAEDVNNLISGTSNPLKKAALIFEFVKAKVKWNGFIGYSAENGVRKAYKEGVGNIADINLMLTSMLRYAGLNANPVLVSTKNNGIPLFPSTSGFNYVISLIETPEGVILLDASEKYSSPNVLPKRALNWQGRIIRKEGSSDWINLLPKKASIDFKSINYKINEDLTISGKIRNRLTSHNALSYRKKFKNLNTEEHIEHLEKDKGEIIVSSLKIENEADISKPILTSYEFTLDDNVESIGDKLYFSPLLFFTFDENPFKEETRDYPIDFVHPHLDKYMVNIMMPEGYEVEALPENINYKLPEDEGNYSYLIKKNGKYLQISIAFNYANSLVLSSRYQTFRAFFNSYIEKTSEKIVLKKI
jgi:Domain of Unknown Function with PDB structure (DUF3857)